MVKTDKMFWFILLLMSAPWWLTATDIVAVVYTGQTITNVNWHSYLGFALIVWPVFSTVVIILCLQ